MLFPGIRFYTWSQYRISISPDGTANDLPHVRHNDILHQYENGSNFKSKHVGVCRRRQPLASHRYQVQTARKLIEKSRMTCQTRNIKTLSELLFHFPLVIEESFLLLFPFKETIILFAVFFRDDFPSQPSVSSIYT